MLLSLSDPSTRDELFITCQGLLNEALVLNSLLHEGMYRTGP